MFTVYPVKLIIFLNTRNLHNNPMKYVLLQFSHEETKAQRLGNLPKIIHTNKTWLQI